MKYYSNDSSIALSDSSLSFDSPSSKEFKVKKQKKKISKDYKKYSPHTKKKHDKHCKSKYYSSDSSITSSNSSLSFDLFSSKELKVKKKRTKSHRKYATPCIKKKHNKYRKRKYYNIDSYINFSDSSF